MSKCERRKRQLQNAAALIARGKTHRAQGLIRCVQEDEKREATGYRTWRCQNRNCLFCCGRYSQRLTRKCMRKMGRVMGDGYRLSFLTLTIPNTLSLNPHLYKWLGMNLKRLMARSPFKGRVVGAIARIETDFNPDSQDFHPHIHIILIYKQCIPQREIAEAWRDLINPQVNEYVPSDAPGREGRPCVVRIKKIKPEEIRRTVAYLFKSKPFEDADAFAEYDCAVRNVRLIQTYGALRGRRRRP